MKKNGLAHSINVGLSFGLTSGVITTLGLIVGLYAGTHSKSVVIAAILTVAIADSLSDALGIHVAEESENVHTQKEIWTATFVTFLAKLFCSLLFLIPLLILPLDQAFVVSVIGGLILIGVLTYYIARRQNTHPYKMIIEHLGLAMLVIVLTYLAGLGINTFIYNS